MDNVIPFPKRAEPSARTEPPARTRPAVQPEPLWRELVGAQLRTERLDRDLRISDVAQRAGVSPQYLSEVERGVKEPSSEVLSAVAGALRLSIVEIAGRVARQAPVRVDGPVCLAA